MNAATSSTPTRCTQDAHKRQRLHNHKLMMEDDTNASTNGSATAAVAVEKDDGKDGKSRDGLVSSSAKTTGNGNNSSTGSALDVDRTANKGGKNDGYEILGMIDNDIVNVDCDENSDKDVVDDDTKNDAEDDATDDTLAGAKDAAMDEARVDAKDDSEHRETKDVEQDIEKGIVERTAAKSAAKSADESADESVLFQTDDTALLLRLKKDPAMDDSKDSPHCTALVLEVAKPPTAVWVNAEHVHPPPLHLTETTSPVTIVTVTSTTDYSYCSNTCWIVAIVLVLVSYAILFLAVQLTPVPDPQPRETLVTNYINRVKLSPGTLSIPQWRERVSSTTTSEAAALAWLIYNDPLQLSPDNNEDKLRLRQRYALLTLLLQFPDFVANATFFESTDHECDWESVACETGVESGWRYVGGIAITGTMSSVGSTLSPDLGLLTRLEYIDVSSNALVGSLPSSLGPKWSDLESFTVFNNYLTGTLPATMATTWTNLRYVNANLNELSGSLPSMLGANSTNLHFFHVADNNLTGTIPSSLNSWDNLFEASFGDNRFVGSVPDSFCMALHLDADCDEVDCPCCTLCF